MDGPTGAETEKRHSYGAILKSSALIGATSVLNVAFAIARNKAMAVLLEPSGFGLIGLYASIAELAQNIFGLGVNSSAVREVAAAVASGETERIAKTVIVLRRLSLALGIFGAAVLAACSSQIAQITFGNSQHTVGVAMLSLAVLFRLVSASQNALLQGMRRIRDMATQAIIGNLFGTLISIAAVFVMRDRGIVPALVAASVASLAISWWYTRKVRIPAPAMSMREQAREAAPLLKLGLAFMLSGFFVLAASYATRIMVLRTVSIEAAGFYQAAWTLGGIYVGFILSAMGADFYPRLAAVADQHGECNSLVNEQIHVGVLMASPGVIVTLALAPIVLPIFYTSDFAMAEPLLRWFCIGMALRVVTWPMGFILVAQGRQRLFLLTDAAWSIVNVVLSWICLKLFGLQGAGIAFCAAYVVYGLLFYPIVRALTGFRFSASNKRHMALFGGLIGAVFGACYLLPSIHRAAFGLLVGIAGSFYSARTLAALMPTRRIPRPILRVFTFLRILPKE